MLQSRGIMKWILLVFTLIMVSLLLASRVSSDALQDCEDEIEELKEDAEDQIDNINTMRSSESKASRELHAIKTAIVELRLHSTSFMYIRYLLVEMNKAPPINNQCD